MCSDGSSGTKTKGRRGRSPSDKQKRPESSVANYDAPHQSETECVRQLTTGFPNEFPLYRQALSVNLPQKIDGLLLNQI